ncbi:HAD-IA family hydrolase [Heyndrickxia acidicola]|uniref:HAD-IA family hydrolase n=1 Tax=Heyndrickxia acidicola TaxID=209389 RepID=A0ABU6MM33_9BACI|nr:HAD-IA family hydrolase [Heyndrickxia acidicola]MED1205580.1 HAD-IA family hydrolase [Heyndrickxia acidicola]
MFKTVIFDFDGTLVYSRSLAIQLFNDFADKYGYKKIRDDEVQYLSTLSIPNRLKALKCPMYKLPMLLIDMKKKYKRDVVTLGCVDGIREVLRDLKKHGLTIGILSSNYEENIKSFLDSNKIDNFDFVYTASNIFGKDKAILRLMKEKGITPSEMLYIGDELRDIEACNKIHVPCAAVTWGFEAEELLISANPQYIIHEPVQICNIIKECST